MRSVADDLRSETRRGAARHTPAERIELAFRLAEEDMARLCAARGISREQAIRLIERSRSVGRAPSVSRSDPV